ncbi:MAG TPA: DUF58 domain-containing protein [Spirochaetia bacterium]|nr:DUF58 domain-containing protein [Spirochaetales bacterium]HRY78914.1 DUF58 domain-containing protein [Spirochaetia bacterium]
MAEESRTPYLGSLFGTGGMGILLALLTAVAAAGRAYPLARLSAVVLILMLALRAWTRIGSARLSASFELGNRRLFAGESSELGAEIVNRSPLALRLRLELPKPAGIEATRASCLTAETSLLPFERRRGSWAFTAARRGIHSLGPVRLSAGDPLGLFTRERELPFPDELVVFPRILPLALPDLPFREYFGIRAARGIVEDPAWYEGTREYSGNRPARNIHWKASARLAALQEKIFQPTSHRKVFLLVEGELFERAGDGEGFERALQIAGSLASLLSESGASFALATDRAVRDFPAALDLGRGPEHLGAVLELLARCGIERGRDFRSLLAGTVPGNTGFLVLARSPGGGAGAALAGTAGRRDPVLFLYAEPAGGGEPESTTPADHRAPPADRAAPAGISLRFTDLLPPEDNES